MMRLKFSLILNGETQSMARWDNSYACPFSLISSFHSLNLWLLHHPDWAFLGLSKRYGRFARRERNHAQPSELIRRHWRSSEEQQDLTRSSSRVLSRIDSKGEEGIVS